MRGAIGGRRALAVLVLMALAPVLGLRPRAPRRGPAQQQLQQLREAASSVALTAALLLAGPLEARQALAADAPAETTGLTRRKELEVLSSAPRPKKLPFSDVENRKPTAASAQWNSEVRKAREKIAALKPYLDEIQRYIYTEDYAPLRAFLNVFSAQEEAFLTTIESVGSASRGPAASVTAEAMEHEAKEIFLALDDIRKAATLQKPVALKKGYIKLALAYDRYLKASDNLPLGYDNVVSTEKFFADVPDEWLVYDTETLPVSLDPVLFIAGPDKGRTGILLGYKSRPIADVAANEIDGGPLGFLNKKDKSGTVRTAVVKMDNYLSAPKPGEQQFNEVKEVPTAIVARQKEF